MIVFTYRQFLMAIWLLSECSDRLTEWENKFLRSILQYVSPMRGDITIKQDMKIWQIYEKNRRPREYYASTMVDMGDEYEH